MRVRTLETICSASTKERSLWISPRWVQFSRGVFELRDRDPEHWYRVLYVPMDGLIYVLHCFTKKTNQTPPKEIETARKRLQVLRLGVAKRKKEATHEK
jgi:phage-related protein